MSIAFHRVGIEMKSFSQKLVRPSTGRATLGRILLNGKPTATRADELSEWLRLQPFAGRPVAEDIAGRDREARIKARTGIVSLSGYWRRDGESAGNARGGHIDVWNGTRLTISGPLNAIATFGRMLEFNSFAADCGFGFSDLEQSRKTRFREIT